MGKVLMEITMSLDGYTTGPEVSAEAHFGRGGERLHGWMFARLPARLPTESGENASCPVP